MYKFLFVFSILFFNNIFASTAVQTAQNVNNIIKDKELIQKPEKSQQEIFKQNSFYTVKELLSYKKIPYTLLSKRSVRNYYKNNNYNLFWIDENGIKDIALTLLHTVKNDPVLKPTAKNAFNLNHVINKLSSLEESNNNYMKSMVKIDFLLTGIYDRYMKYLSNGYINWKSFKRELRKLDEKEEILADWEKHNVKKSFIKLLYTAINSNDLELAFNEVNYTYPKARELSDAIKDFEDIEQKGGYTKLPYFKVLRYGDSSPVIKLLRKRLVESKDLKENICEGDNSYNKAPDTNPQVAIADNATNIITDSSNTIEDVCYEKFDKLVKQAVISFQANHGLLADGIVGSTSRKYLNISIKSKIVKIRLNLERMRWLPRSLGEKFLVVNIPEYKLKMYEEGEVKLDMAIVVGTRKNPTPVFSNKMSFIVLNPYWRIPPSIVKNEIIPKLLKNSKYLDGKGINLHPNWDQNSTQFDLDTIDWSLYDEDRVAQTTTTINEEGLEVEETIPLPQGKTMRFIQIPSEKNPLGRIKFMFPNKYAVYLHDTPAKRFFKYTKRAYSHGCVRLSRPKDLLKAIAQEDDNVDYDSANTILEDIEKTQIGLNKKIPVHMVYLTSWMDENNNIQFRDDVYKYDKIQKNILYRKKYL